MAFGILSYGAYIPRLRLKRSAIVRANGWSNPSLLGKAKGERSMCNWDEDPVTMAVAAARDALTGRPRRDIKALRFASTTFPFLDRLNAGIVAAALDLPSETSAVDIGNTQRAATSALLMAQGGREETLVIAAEKRRARAAGPLELVSGDGAAAILFGEGEPIARLIGSATGHADFVDHYRTAESVFDYQWEERWIRDAGYMSIVSPVIMRCLEAAAVRPGEITHFCMPTGVPRVANAVAKAMGIADEAVCDDLQGRCGDTGAAHHMIMLVAALEQAEPGDRILVVGFGQGADALLFEVDAPITARPAALGVKGHLARRREEENYSKYLSFNDLIEIERGMRAEADKMTPLSAMWRNRETVTSFVGGRCTACGTVQFPSSRICVSPECNAIDTQERHAFADTLGRIASYTADRLTYSPDPPACFGMIQFDGGGRLFMDFADVDADAISVGQEMSMVFRIKDIDAQRGFRRYFWKAAPAVAN